MRKAMVLGVLGLAGTLASPAFADDFTGFRLGLNLSSDMVHGDFNISPLPGEVDKISASRFGYGMSAGWALNRWLAFEGALLGGSNMNEDTFTDTLPTNEYFTSRTDVKGAEASVVGTLWIGHKFAFFGRLGAFAWQAKERVDAGFFDDPTSRTTLTVKDSGFDPVYGLGIQTVLDRALIRFEYKLSSIGDLVYIDKGDPTTPADDTELYGLRKTDFSQLQLSFVWTLR